MLALQRRSMKDPTLFAQMPSPKEYAQVIDSIEEEIADMVARRSSRGRAWTTRSRSRCRSAHRSISRNLRREALKEEDGPENSTTLKRLAELEELDEKGLGRFGAGRDAAHRSDGVIVRRSRSVAAHQDRHPHIPSTSCSLTARVARPPWPVRARAGQALHLHTLGPEAPFVEVDATTIRWDPREITTRCWARCTTRSTRAQAGPGRGGNPRPSWAWSPRPTAASSSSTRSASSTPILHNKLLKVLEDKRIVLRVLYFDEDDPRVPPIHPPPFHARPPADFILIGATTREPQDITPAIRSRCAEVYFEPLSARQSSRSCRTPRTGWAWASKRSHPHAQRAHPGGPQGRAAAADAYATPTCANSPSAKRR